MHKAGLEAVWMQKFHHPISVIQFPSLITHHSSLNFHTRLAPSPNFHHSIFFTLFVDSILVTWSEHLCFVTRGTFSSHQPSLFSFPLPLQPCHSPKAETQTHKNFSSPLASSGPSPVNNTQLSDVYGGAISSVVTHFPAAPTSIKKWDPFLHFVTDDLLRAKTVLLHPLNVLSHLDYLSDLHLGFEKNERF